MPGRLRGTGPLVLPRTVLSALGVSRPVSYSKSHEIKIRWVMRALHKNYEGLRIEVRRGPELLRTPGPSLASVPLITASFALFARLVGGHALAYSRRPPAGLL